MRDMCQFCQLPRTRCICASASVVDCTVKISAIQHPDEEKHPKNTLRLAKSCLPNLDVFVGALPEDFEVLQRQCQQSSCKPCVVFPTETSESLESVSADMPKHLIFIDATWRKAFKIYSTNPWLQALPCFHYNHAPVSQYHLRKTSRAQGLSTLEAIAYGISLTEQIDVQPLYAIQGLWMDQKRAMMPLDIQQRYEP